MIELVKPRFIADLNVGRLAKRLRMLGYDTLFISGLDDDDDLVRIALKEGRVLLTRDTGIMKRRVVSSGKIEAILIRSDDIKKQLEQVVMALHLKLNSSPFSLCMECNRPLIEKERDEVRNLVPPYVFETREQYMQCPGCERIYWRGTHWERMNRELQALFLHSIGGES